MHHPLLSRFLGRWVLDLDAGTLRADALAGLLGAVLVLPQGIAFATLAGLPPQYGLYAAVVPCAVAALFGSSRHVVSGPTNANSLALFAMLAPLAVPGSPEYVKLALAATLLVGLMQWLVGVLKLGSLANFISPSVLLGFTGGAGLLIVVHGLADLLGLPPSPSHRAAAVVEHVLHHVTETGFAAPAVAAVTLAGALLAGRLHRRAPALLVGLAAGMLAAWALHRLPGDAAEVARLGVVPPALPPFTLPWVPAARWPDLMSAAFALTIVALGQSVSIAKAVAQRSGQHIDTNREFIGQGLSNIAGSFFSSYVSCGSLNRSMPNLEAGARTPMASVFSAGALVLLVALAGPLLAWIPMAGISAVLLLIAWRLLDLPRWRLLWRLDRDEFAIALATLVATLALRIEVAILLGTMLSLVAYLYRTARPAMRTMGFDTMAPDRHFIVADDNPQALPECPQLKLLRMEGPVYFGAMAHVMDRLQELREQPPPLQEASGRPDAPSPRGPGGAQPGAGSVQKHLLVMSKSMNFIDLAGAEVWQRELALRRAMGGDLYFHRPRPPVEQMWQRVGFDRALGPGHVFRDKRSAIQGIFQALDPQVCATCKVRVFWECGPPPGAD